MTQKELYSDPGWQWCTSEGAELHALLLGLRTPFREKLEWLEEMETLSLQMSAGREASATKTDADRREETFGAWAGKEMDSRKPASDLRSGSEP